MAPLPSDAGNSPLKVRSARASTVILHRVPAQHVALFLQWQRDVAQVVGAFPGYQATDVYPPTDPEQPEWVAVIHFDTNEALQRWLASPERAEWTAKLPPEMANFQLKTLTTGFGPWFAGLVADGGLPPPWKMALAVLLPLYPTVMLLNLYLTPYTHGLGLAVSVLIGNAVSIALLQWVLMPILNLGLVPWLRANGASNRALSLTGLLVILALLALLTSLFRLVTG